MQLNVIRHGHKANQQPDYDGGFNTPLSDIGTEQVEHLADFLETQDIDCLYSSCQLRALQTAEPIHDRLDCEWHVWPIFYEGTRTSWRDRHAESPEDAAWATAWRAGESLETPSRNDLDAMHGQYYLLSDIPELFPEAQLSQPFPFPDAWWKLKRGFSRQLGYARAELGLGALLSRHEREDRVAVVCHGTFADMMLTTLMDFPRRRRHFECDNTGIHRVDQRDDGEWRIIYVNKTEHLPPELEI